MADETQNTGADGPVERSATPSPGSSGGGSSGGSSKKAYTAPKGRPTRARTDTGRRRKAFGPVAQWITFAAALVLIVVIVIMITGGGDFNPLNDDPLGAPSAAVDQGR